MTEPIIYHNPTPVAVAIIRCSDGYLAIKRAIPPIGGLALPGGFVNEGESAEVAVAREVLEETGYDIPSHMWVPVRTSVTPRNQLLIFMVTDRILLNADLAEFKVNEEASAVHIVFPGQDLCFPLHTSALAAADDFYTVR